MPDISSRPAAPPSRPAVEPGFGRISLPKPLTGFIGRERELTQAKRLLQDSYLVTLTGPGGSGKTRLCIALAATVADDYPTASTSSRSHPSVIRDWCHPRLPRASGCKMLGTGR